MCKCRQGVGWIHINKCHRAICGAVAAAVKESRKFTSGVMNVSGKLVEDSQLRRAIEKT
jgi:hypothetical protein